MEVIALCPQSCDGGSALEWSIFAKNPRDVACGSRGGKEESFEAVFTVGREML